MWDDLVAVKHKLMFLHFPTHSLKESWINNSTWLDPFSWPSLSLLSCPLFYIFPPSLPEEIKSIYCFFQLTDRRVQAQQQISLSCACKQNRWAGNHDLMLASCLKCYVNFCYCCPFPSYVSVLVCDDAGISFRKFYCTYLTFFAGLPEPHYKVLFSSKFVNFTTRYGGLCCPRLRSKSIFMHR